jgi:hypothetical protein
MVQESAQYSKWVKAMNHNYYVILLYNFNTTHFAQV